MATKPKTIRFPVDLDKEVKEVIELDKYKSLGIDFTKYVLYAVREQIKRDKESK